MIIKIIIIFHFINFYFMQKKYFDLSYKHYEENVIIEDMIFMNPKNNSAYNLPKIKNTTIYISNINSSFDEKIFRILFGLISILFNQYPKPCISKHSNSNLKIQKKDLVGIKINLNKKNTYFLLENFAMTFPRIAHSKPKRSYSKNNFIIEISDIIKIYNSEFQYDMFSRCNQVNVFFKISKFSSTFFNLFSIPKS